MSSLSLISWSPIPSSSVLFAHFPVFMIFHTHVNYIGGVWYICKGNTLTEGNNRPFQGSIFTIPSGVGGREPSTVGWLFPSPSERMTHAIRYNECVSACVKACTCMPVCGFLDHMVMFTSLHICASNNSSLPHRNGQSLSGLIRHIPDLYYRTTSDLSLVLLL